MELSLNEQIERVGEAVYRMTEDAMMRPGYCIAVYPTYAIVEWREQYWRIGYTMDDDGTVTLAERDTWQEVQREWVVKTFKAVWSIAYQNDLPDSAFLYIEPGKEKDEDGKTTPRSARHFPYRDQSGKVDLPHLRNAIARIPQSNAPGLTAEKKQQLQDKARRLLEKAQGKSFDDTLVVFGSEIKALGNGKVGGYLVRFTDAAHPDLENDFFTKDTDFDTSDGDSITIYYNHGFDPVLKTRKLGKGIIAIQDIGIWVEAQLAMRDDYEKAIYAMAEKGKLGWSSGTLGYLVEREPDEKAMWVKSWPLGKDASLTPTPAAGPILTAVQPLKSWAEATQTLQALTPQAAGDAATRSATAESGQAYDTSAAKRLSLELELLAL